MKILLIGEYSRLHNSLKEGLQALGHEVVLLGYSDSFKDYPVDHKLEKRWDRGLLKKLNVAIYQVTGFDVGSYLTYVDLKKIRHTFIGFDVVQLINENSFYFEPKYEIRTLQFLFANNKKVFLLSCGDDYLNVKFNFENPNEKSVVQPYLEGKIPDKDFPGVLKFRLKPFEKLHHYLYNNINGVIATDLDYHLPLIGNSKYLGMIPNPVNVDKITFTTLDVSGKVVIFLGINHESYFKKGIDYFEKALEIIQKKYPDLVEISISRSIPYELYIKLYDKAHILLDQAYAKDQGYNALEAMAKGKVVFTGAGYEFAQHYNLTETVAINTVADVNQLVISLEKLILDKSELVKIGKRARDFVEKQHEYKEVSRRYLDVWMKN